VANSVEVGDLNISLVLESNEFKAELDEALSRLDSAGRQAKSQSASYADLHFALRDVGDAFATLGGTVREAVQDAADFDTGLRRIKALGVEKDINAIGKEVTNLSEQFGADKRQLIESYYGAISAGIKEADIEEFLATSVKASEATGAAVGDVNEALLTMMESFGETATVSSDALMTIAREGRTNLGDLSRYVGDLAPLAKSAGVSMSDFGGAVIAATKSIGHTGKAVTGLRQMMSNLIKPSETAVKTSERLGIQFNTAALESMGLTKWLQHVQEKTGGNVEEMSKLFGSVEALNVVLGLLKGEAKNVSEGVAAMGEAAGETARQHSEVGDSVETALNKMNQSYDSLGKAFGKANEGGAVLFANMKGWVYGTLASWIQSNETLSTGMGYVTSALGEMGFAFQGLTSVGQFVFSMKQIATVLPTIKFAATATKISTMATSLTTMSSSALAAIPAIAGMTAPLWLTAAAIAAVGAAAIATSIAFQKWMDAEEEKNKAALGRNEQLEQERQLYMQLMKTQDEGVQKYAETKLAIVNLTAAMGDENNTKAENIEYSKEMQKLTAQERELRAELGPVLKAAIADVNAETEAAKGNTQAKAEMGEVQKTLTGIQEQARESVQGLSTDYQQAMSNVESSTGEAVERSKGYIESFMDTLSDLYQAVKEMALGSWYPDAMQIVGDTTAVASQRSMAAMNEMSGTIDSTKKSLLDFVRLNSEIAKSGAINAFHAMRDAKGQFRAGEGGGGGGGGNTTINNTYNNTPNIDVQVDSALSRETITGMVSSQLKKELSMVGV